MVFQKVGIKMLELKTKTPNLELGRILVRQTKLQKVFSSSCIAMIFTIFMDKIMIQNGP